MHGETMKLSQPIYLKIHLNIVLPSTPVSPKWALPLISSNRNPSYPTPIRHTCYLPRPSHSFKICSPE